MKAIEYKESIRIPFVFELFFSDWEGRTEKSLERISLFLNYLALMLIWAMASALVSLMAGANEVSMVPLTFVILTLLNIFIFQSKWGGRMVLFCSGLYQRLYALLLPSRTGGCFLRRRHHALGCFGHDVIHSLPKSIQQIRNVGHLHCRSRPTLLSGI